MFDFVTGQICQLTPTAAVIEAGGVGWFINISLQTHKLIAPLEKAKLFLHMYIVQNDAPVLYGFASMVERDMFRLLISISGIGANTARVMLSTYSTEELAGFIALGNSAAIRQTKGIGAKTAERVVLELKDKVLKVMSGVQFGEQSVAHAANADAMNEALEALAILGFAKNATEKVVNKICNDTPNLSVEVIIKEALGKL